MSSAPQRALIAVLARLSPSLGAQLEEHIVYNGGMLPHVFLGDVTRYVAELADASPEAPQLQAMLDLLEDRFPNGAADEQEMIAVSFIENLPAPDEEGSELRYILGPKLTEQLKVTWPTDSRLHSN